MRTWAVEKGSRAVKRSTWAVPGHDLGGEYFMIKVLIKQLFTDDFETTCP